MKAMAKAGEGTAIVRRRRAREYRALSAGSSCRTKRSKQMYVKNLGFHWRLHAEPFVRCLFLITAGAVLACENEYTRADNLDRFKTGTHNDLLRAVELCAPIGSQGNAEKVRID
jgi:hypothetical protein